MRSSFESCCRQKKHGKGMRYSGIGSFGATEGSPDICMTKRKKDVEKLTEADEIRCDHDGLYNIPLAFLKKRTLLNSDQWL